MISLNKIYYIFFITTLLFGFYFYNPIKIGIIDEFLIFLLACLCGLQILTTKNIASYKGLFLIFGIFLFYLLYSLIVLKFNTPEAIISDFFIQLKPFIAFYCTYSIAPQFSEKQKKTLRKLCLFLGILMLWACISGELEKIFFHVAYAGINMSIVAIIFYMLGDDTLKNKIITILLLSIGLFGTRSKFYGFFLLSIFMLFWFKPDMIRKIRIKYIIIGIILLVGIISVAWQKINYYFIEGEKYEIGSVAETGARAVLYITAPKIFLDYPIFGSGLGSYATFSSGEVGYSKIYEKYDIEKVFGLQEGDCPYVSDTFYPELVQFGAIGIILFIFFWRFIIKKLLSNFKKNGNLKSLRIGILMFSFVMIESLAGSAFLQGAGICAMIILGIILSDKSNLIQTDEERLKRNGEQI